MATEPQKDKPADGTAAAGGGSTGQVLAGKLHAPVDTVYPIEKIKEALAHADRGGRNGKILVAPNGPV